MSDNAATPPDTGPAGTALVTGPTSGIGRAFAVALAERRHDLVLVARDAARLEALAAELVTAYDVVVEVLVADLTDRDQLADVEARLSDPTRPVGTLVNNAGFGMGRSFLSSDVADQQAQLDVLVTAPMRLLHAALPGMVERGRGDVVNVSSVAGFLPGGTYGAAKAYLTSLSTWAHVEYAGRGVRVVAVCPGYVRTEFHERMGISTRPGPRFLWLDADRVVREGLADLDAGKAVSIPSRRYRVLIALARTLPASWVRWAQKRTRRR